MAYNTIRIWGDPKLVELTCDAAITPGMLCERTTTGAKKHATAGGSCQRIFAIEDENQGNEISDDYSTSGRGFFVVCAPGDEVYALLADGENAAIGSKLESNGDGYLRVVDADASVGDIIPGSIVGVALEALDMSGSSGADPSSQRIRIEIW